MLLSIQYTFNGSWIQALQVMRLWLQFGSACFGWTIIMKYTKRPDLLWATVKGSLTLVYFPSLSWRTKSFKIKTAWSDISMVWPVKSKSLLSPFFSLGFTQGYHVNKTGAEGSKVCGAVSSYSWNGLQCWFVELMLFICIIIGYNNHWDLIWTYVPYYCFSYPRRSRAFSNPSLAHPQLFHISESVFCKETLASLWNFTTFLPKIVVCKFHLLKILHYLCLYFCFINFISWYFCNSIFYISVYNPGL